MADAPHPRIPGTYCVPWQGYPASPYGYRPSLAAGIIFIILYAVSATLHVYTGTRSRVWWQYTFAVGAIAELFGWAGRTWSSQCPYQTTPFLMQVSTLIFAPAFFTAGIYVILGRLIKVFGRDTSPLSPNLYLYIFFGIDVVSLVVQAAGGGIAATSFARVASGADDGAPSRLGGNIVLGGIVFQLASILVFSVLMAYVLNNARRLRKPALKERRIQAVIGATVFSVLCMVARGIFRTIELQEGWAGPIARQEKFVLSLDGAIMVAAVAIFNIVPPGWSGWGLKGGVESSREKARQSPFDAEAETDSGLEMELGETTEKSRHRPSGTSAEV